MSRADALALAFAAATAVLVVAWGPVPLAFVIPTGLLGILLADAVFRPQSRTLVPVVVRGPADGGCVALTFDDGPDPAATPAILDALAHGGARATFFTIGRALRAHPELGRRVVSEGHELANHSFSHSRLLNFRGPRAMTADIDAGAQAAFAISKATPLYRPPIGLKSPVLAAVAHKEGLTVVAWSLHARDTRGLTSEQIADRVLSRVRPGDIVLLHDGCDRGVSDRSATVRAIPAILAGLAERQLRCVTVSELLR